MSMLPNQSYAAIGVPLWASASSGTRYNTTYPSIWQGTPPKTVEEAIDRLSMILYGRTATIGMLPMTYPESKVIVNDTTQLGTDVLIAKYNTDGSVLWAATIGGSVADIGSAITADSAGNSYVTGYYASSPLTIFNSDKTVFGTLANSGNNDTFVVKYNTTGTAQWATRIGGVPSEAGNGIFVDSAGNSYVIGALSSTATIFNADGSTFGTITSAGNTDAFIVKYNTSGFAQWATRIGGTALESGNAITVDSSGNSYVTGLYVSNPVTIFNADGSTFGTLANAGGNDAFVVKYNTTGFAQWATRIAGATGTDNGNAITVDSSGNSYVTGQYTSSSLTIYNADGSTFGTLPFAGSIDAFVVKYNTSGFAQWATRIAGTGTDVGNAITVDSAGNSYVTGNSGGSLTIFNVDGTTFSTLQLFPSQQQIFTVKYNTNGFAQWVNRAGGSGTSVGRAITVDSSGNVSMTGTIQNGMVFNPDGSIANLAGTQPYSIIKYDTNGYYLWYAAVSSAGVQGNGIATDSSRNIYVVGTVNTAFPIVIRSAGL